MTKVLIEVHFASLCLVRVSHFVALRCTSLPADRLGHEILGAGKLWADCWDAAQRLDAQAVRFPQRWHIRVGTYIRDKMRRDMTCEVVTCEFLHIYIYTYINIYDIWTSYG